MKLDVLPDTHPWYANGLKFTCTQCGNCCTGGPGFVWISLEEITRLAAFLQIDEREALRKYCRKAGTRWSLKERRTPQGNYDCIFLKDLPAPRSPHNELSLGDPIPLQRRGCSIYPVRPIQCRTWPFWESNLSDPKMWDFASRKCPGINQGNRSFTRKQIESLRDAKSWPQRPPSS